MGRTNIKGYKQTKRTYKLQAVDTWEKAAALDSLEEYDMAKIIDVIHPSLPSSHRSQKKRQIYWWREKAGVIRKRSEAPAQLYLPTETEEQIVMWINDLRNEGLVVMPLMLQIKAQEETEELGIA